MTDKNLIIALSFAAIFGAALVWLIIYYLHSYFHRKWIEFEHWVHVVTPPKWRSTCRHCEGTGRTVVLEKNKSRSRSRKRTERSRDRSRPRHGRGQRAIEDTDWNGHSRMHQPRAALPTSLPAQRHVIEEPYNPWATWQSQGPGGQQSGMAYPQPAVYPQMYPQTFQQAYPQTSPFMISQQRAPQTAMPIPESVSSRTTHHKRERKVCVERPEERESEAAQTKPKSAMKSTPNIRQTDYFHIVDEYPPIVLESIKRSAPPSSYSSSSSSSSASTEPAEVVPRTSIPQAAPRFANPTSYEIPTYLYPATRAWQAPTSYPRQWTGVQGASGDDGRRANEQARYAQPYTKARDWRSEDVNAHWGRRAPSKDSFSNIEPPRWSTSHQRDYAMRTPRRKRSIASSESSRKHKERGHTPTPPKREANKNPVAGPSSPIVIPAPPLAQPPAAEHVRNMSPMPQPVIEEPPSVVGSPKVKPPIVTANGSRPRASSPRLDVRLVSRGSSSGISSLHE